MFTHSFILFLISCTCMFLAGLSNSAMDTLRDHYGISIFSEFKEAFWNPSISWMNKYNQEYYNLYGVWKEKFFGAKTWFVFVTDGWHLSKAVFLLMIGLSAVFFRLPNWSFFGYPPSPFVNTVLAFLLLKSAFGMGFKWGFESLWLKKNAPNNLPIS